MTHATTDPVETARIELLEQGFEVASTPDIFDVVYEREPVRQVHHLRSPVLRGLYDSLGGRASNPSYVVGDRLSPSMDAILGRTATTYTGATNGEDDFIGRLRDPGQRQGDILCIEGIMIRLEGGYKGGHHSPQTVAASPLES